MNILIVDDKEENQYLLEALLKGNGYNVQQAANGAEALELLKSGSYDLIISDILMPAMDGFELCRRVKADKELRHIPFIIYTATYTGPLDEAFAVKIGADRFIQKPCEPEVFMDVVRNVMSASGSGNIAPTPALQDEEVLKLYNERLVRKLEQKMLQLEKEILTRHEIEKVLRNNEKKYRSLYNSIRDAILVLDMDRTIIDCNPAFVDLFGYSLEEIKGKKTFIFYENEEEFREMGKALKEHIGDVSFLYAINFRKKNGTVFTGELNVFFLVNDEGISIGYIGLIRDITKQKRAEKIQKDLESQLQQSQKMEAIGLLAGGVVHDFNNFLSIILGYSELLLQKLDEDHPDYKALHVMNIAANKSKDLTRQLLAFSRKQIFEIQILDVNSVIRGFEKLLIRLIGEDIELDMALAPEPLLIKADAAQLEQVLMNLAVNARDAMPAGGILTIETAVVDLDEAYVNEMPDIIPSRCAMIAVSDTGTGMTRDILNRIFEPFFTTKDKEKGTGLGLATSYGIIRQHGGNIWVDSKPGKGTVFKIFLPLCEENPAAETRYEKSQAPVTGSPVVLIIEDDHAVRNLAGHILAGHGYSVILSDDPADAVARAAEHDGPIHLVLTDVVMPGMKGPEVYDKIREHHPDARVLYMSGYTDDMIIRHGVQKEGTAYIQKPFTAGMLLEKCRKALHNE